ncbi:flagellar hook-associated protein FlgL [Orlajensenia leifsoniae]|uniref:Flagellar hook-associated protein 3 n=1 Tax=Orlajensenia leifsoniae TaxID=2561933 RepID=A0A4Y9R2A2_9MICO|nr:flagellar hook-associated protein FlgL [Leifsonia flava]TFV98811.1 flagellar hook-associated protein 3 [Leifsonia flava]
MITRVTQTMMMRSAQQNLQASAARLAATQEKAASLRAISRPSDDPTGTADALRTRAEQRSVDQYTRNADNGIGWLTTADTALSTASNVLRRARDLTVQGANDGALSPTAKEAIAVELESLRDDLLGIANTAYLGRSVFAGNSDAGVAFQADFSFTSAAGSTVQRRVADDQTVRVDADGDAAFGSGAASVFQLLTDIAADLRSGRNVQARLGEIDDRATKMVSTQAEVGQRQAQIERAEEMLVAQTGSLEARRAAIEDVDLGQISLDLKMQELAYQSAIAVSAKVLPATLMDYLR